MGTFATFERDLRLATKGLEPAEISKALARFSRSELAKVIASGEGSPNYDKFVNGREGVPEEQVKTPGPIVYQFIHWPVIINAAIEELRKRIRSKSGRYAASFIVIAGGKLVTDYKTIAPTAEVIIVNAQPYTRRLDNAQDSNRRHFLGAYRALRRRFGEGFQVLNMYLNIKSGVHPMIPYILKVGSKRRDRQRGMPITYPALIINAI